MLHPAFLKALRYVVSGAAAAVVNLGTLFVLTRQTSVWYLWSSVIAFSLSFIVSFSLQRLWTFEVRGKDNLIEHSGLYLLAALVNLLINTAFVYMFVEYAGIGYVLSQFLAGVIVAFESFFVYRAIFRI